MAAHIKIGGIIVYQVSYSNVEGTNLYKVWVHALGQGAYFAKGYLVMKVGMNPRCLIGCQELSVHAIMELGFVVPNESEMVV
ncbi:hypothetical protein OR571_22570 [Psychrobacillus sp. NEAU-3TGS]|uniref:hypothetical protein n=1 Tax=Psychrobacillus sp. NEAU-3TGS TaxID=2995412 RepID=UPI00249744E7|nr:hypothetical protein [Psychrobacillus sp. NEAU-3TGS]MDI2589813.1 hypothetical protein [Psychrobacillus sp. NEAU-3TGS]